MPPMPPPIPRMLHALYEVDSCSPLLAVRSDPGFRFIHPLQALLDIAFSMSCCATWARIEFRESSQWTVEIPYRAPHFGGIRPTVVSQVSTTRADGKTQVTVTDAVNVS